jgi:hypothetical protein
MRLTVKDGQFDKDGGYTERSYQADLNDAYVLLEKLLESKDSLHFQSDCFGLDYRYLSDTSFEVEIYDPRWVLGNQRGGNTCGEKNNGNSF